MSEPTTASVQAAPERATSALAVFGELVKVRLTGLVVVTTLVGYLLAPQAHAGAARLLLTLAGTWLAAAGAMVLNQWVEADRDALMARTRRRPLPSGRVSRRAALGLGLALSTGGVAVLATWVNLLTAALGAAVVGVYTLVYTPMKVRTPLCTLAGAVCGAIPPLMGWTAASGTVAYGGVLLAGILFLWQIPHFLALAWLYRDDYARGGFRMLPSIDPTGRATGTMALLYSAALVPIGLLATLGGVAGITSALATMVLGAALVFFAARLAVGRTLLDARRLFLATLVYLPLLLGALVADRGAQASAAVALRDAIPHTRSTALSGSRLPR